MSRKEDVNSWVNKIVLVDGRLYKVLRMYEGKDDLSYHGSPWYETFIEVEDLETGEVKEFGDQSYNWRDVLSYIERLERTIGKIKAVLGCK